MTAPTYRLFPHKHVWRTGLFHVEWEITDGIGGPVLESGHRRTRASADLDAGMAQALCKPHPALVLEQRLAPIVARLDREGLRVKVSVDERLRVCVRPLCPCSDRDHRHVMQEFARIASSVRWEVP